MRRMTARWSRSGRSSTCRNFFQSRRASASSLVVAAWRFGARRPSAPEPPCHAVATTNAMNNAGFGWTVSLGSLKPGLGEGDPINPTSRFMYVAPDGSQHYFYQSLHGTTGDGATQYTRDGSYLRLKEVWGLVQSVLVVVART